MYSTLSYVFHSNFPKIRQTSNLNWALSHHYPIIALVRNPYNRTASAYYDKCIKEPRERLSGEHGGLQYCQHDLLRARNLLHDRRDSLVKPAIRIYPEDEQRAVLEHNYATLMSLSFAEYLELLKILFRSERINPHFRPQFAAFYRGGRLVADHVFKMEEMPENWSKICKQILGKELSLPHVNRGLNSDYGRFYDCNSRQIVDQLYDLDFVNFEYARG